MLKDTHPEAYAANPPDLHRWHCGFKLVVDQIAEEGRRLIPFARHVAAGAGLVYPARDEIDQSYVKNLKVPGGATQDYDGIFDWAIDRAGTLWQMVAEAIVDGEAAALEKLPNWNLDIGCQESLVYLELSR